MNFKQYLQECECQAVASGQPALTSSVVDEAKGQLFASINDGLNVELDDVVLSPETGVQKVRKVLMRYGIEVPALYDMDSEDDEIALPIDEHTYLYILYCQTDDGLYDFYAELTDEEGLEEILEDEEDTEE